jgi:hypothetical protein
MFVAVEIRISGRRPSQEEQLVNHMAGDAGKEKEDCHNIYVVGAQEANCRLLRFPYALPYGC